MLNRYLIGSGKPVHERAKNRWKQCVRICEQAKVKIHKLYIDWYNHQVTRCLPTLREQPYTHQLSALSPLFEHIFYPVSTAPITTTNYFKKDL